GIRDYKVTGVQTCALPIWGFHTAYSISGHSVEKAIKLVHRFLDEWAESEQKTGQGRARVGDRDLRHRTDHLSPGGSEQTGFARKIGRASCRERGWGSVEAW